MDHLLYGWNGEENIVAVHPASDQTMRVYTRRKGVPASDDVNFYPFFFLSNPSYLKKFEKHFWIKELEGDNPLRFIAAFTSWSDMWEGIRTCLLEYNASSEAKVQSFQELPILYVRPDPVAQFLKQSGRTMFKKMNFEELHRIQIDIVTLVKRGFTAGNPERPDDKILVVALSDNRGWKHIIQGKKKPENLMLTELVSIIQEKDPDVIEGIFVTNHIIPYLIARYRLHNIEFAVGRDGFVPIIPDMRIAYSERSIGSAGSIIAGRNTIDIQLLHESTATMKQSQGRQALKQLLHITGGEIREQMFNSPQRISRAWETEPDAVIEWSGETVQDILDIGNRLLPIYFSLAQMLPFNLAPVTRISPTAMIDALMFRNYIRRKLSLPRVLTLEKNPEEISEIFSYGIYNRVIVLDVKAIMSSLIYQEGLEQQNDGSGSYTELLGEIINHYKHCSKDLSECTDDTKLDELSAQYKASVILLDAAADQFMNSRSPFHIPAALESLIHALNGYIKDLGSVIKSSGGILIQSDMEGFLFVPPDSVNTESDEDIFIAGLNRKLKSGIILRILGRYKSVLSYRKKNYALLSLDGRVSISGTALIPRSIEGFGKKYLSKSIHALLNSDITSLHETFISFHKNITDHRLDIADYQKTETLGIPLDEYLEEVSLEKRHRSAPYETAILSGLKWTAGDKISYYVCGDDPNPKNFQVYKISDEWDSEFPDENTAYYLKRLSEFAKKFEQFFSPKDFHSIFSAEDLFGFSAEGKTILNTHAVTGEPVRPEEETETFNINPRIWLDV